MAILPGFLANRNRMGIQLADLRVEIDAKNEEIATKNAEIIGLLEMNTTLVEQNKLLKKKLDELKIERRRMRGAAAQVVDSRDMNQAVSPVWMKLCIVLTVGTVGYFAMKMA